MNSWVVKNKIEVLLFSFVILLETSLILMLDNPLFTVISLSVLPPLLALIHCIFHGRWKTLMEHIKSRKADFLWVLADASTFIVFWTVFKHELQDYYVQVNFVLAVCLSYALLHVIE